MIVLGVVAIVLLIVQVGPLVFGKPNPYTDPGKAKKKKATGKVNTKGKAARGSRSKGKTPSARGRKSKASRRAKKKDTQQEKGEGDAAPALAEVQIDLSHVERRVLVYRSSARRDPFSAAPFESEALTTPVHTMKFSLHGVVCYGERRVAIINGRVYAEGAAVAPGVRVLSVSPTGVVLTDGKSQLRLSLKSADLRFRRPNSE